MAQIYGELIRAQLQSSASDLSPTAPGLFYLNSGDKKPTLYDGTAWQKLVTQASLTDLSALPIITPAKGGLGADASAWTGVVKASSGTFSAATIVNADVSATAAIDATKISSGAVSNAKFDKLNTAGSNGPDLLVNTDGTQNLTNKRLIGCRVDDWSDFTEETAAQAAPSGGLLRIYAKDDHKIYKIWSGGVETEIGSGGGGTIDAFTQASPVLAVGDAVYLNGSVYTKAIATSSAAAEVVGVISKDPATLGTNNYEITLSGEVTGLTGLTAGEVYFLSAATAGLLTVTEPSVIGQVSVPVGIASSTTSLYVAPKRGVVIGGVNARAEVSLATAATTNVQTVAGMTAGELSGWVFISSAAPKRFYISAKFSLSGAGGDYNLSYNTSGDVPPVGFSMTITTAGMIQVTLPASSGSTSVINYALNAPAIGASFPLTVDAGTILSGTVASARLPAGQYPGSTAGTAIAAGYVGESYNLKTATDISIGTANTSLLSQSLGAGTWLINAGATMLSATTNTGFVGIYQGATTTVISAETSAYLNSTRAFAGVSHVVTLSATTTIGLVSSVNTSSGTAGAQRCYLVATRIA